MHVRLGFSVAAHLETEIMLVDEVLAVGDAQFQKKCFEKVRSVGRSGRTILFISHNMAALRQVCRRGILLDRGGAVADGEINEVADLYLADANKADSSDVVSETPSYYVNRLQISGRNGAVIKTSEAVEVRIQLTAKTDIAEPGLYVGFQTLDNMRIAGVDLTDFVTTPRIPAGETVELGFVIQRFPLLGGVYQMEVHVKDTAHNKFEFVPRLFRFEVAEIPVYGARKLDHWFGVVALEASALTLTRETGAKAR
jgi:lipopolysaccharide transport system ATP-binding protein